MNQSVSLLNLHVQQGAYILFQKLKEGQPGLSPVTMGLLHTTGGRGTLAGSLCGQLLTWGFASSGLTGSLLGTGHR